MWAEAALTFCYVNAFIPSSCFPDEVPIKIYMKKRHDVSHLRPFGCKCWATLDAIQTDGKLGVRAVEGRFVGYIGRRGYRIWLPQTRTFHESRSVEFEEGDPRRSAPAVPDEVDGEMLGDVDVGSAPDAVPVTPTNENQIQNSDLSIPSMPTTPSTPDYEGLPELFAPQIPPPQPLQHVQIPIQLIHEPDIGPRRGTHIRGPSARQLQFQESAEWEQSALEQNLAWAQDSGTGIDELEENSLAMVAKSPFAFAAESSDKWVPNTYKQAMRHPKLWKAPMQAEYDTLIEKECWTLVDLPLNANLTGGRWVYAIKWSKDGEVAKRTARYVAQGFTQIEGVDYDKTYGAVACMESVRIVLAIIAVLGLFMFQVDFKAAFLNSPINHDVYMKQPEGFVKEGEEHKVCVICMQFTHTLPARPGAAGLRIITL
ncbi:retrovirus-related pol polyprotein [Lentinula edodes]|uniref:Retrovirus-related pol polyprotein n=1 Tax=Lentinula edodes TaxID=5353 RepID=A0A1Q3DZE9_LENED|nr:retrovirus-related pol polyprotein [Lentinula edodes]